MGNCLFLSGNMLYAVTVSNSVGITSVNNLSERAQAVNKGDGGAGTKYLPINPCDKISQEVAEPFNGATLTTTSKEILEKYNPKFIEMFMKDEEKKDEKKISIIGVCIFGLMILLCSCGKDKTAISADEFIKTFESEGYTLSEATDQFGEGDLKACWLAMKDSVQKEENAHTQTFLRDGNVAGTYFAEAREYAPCQGRFLGKDLIAGDQEMPFTLNQNS